MDKPAVVVVVRYVCMGVGIKCYSFLPFVYVPVTAHHQMGVLILQSGYTIPKKHNDLQFCVFTIVVCDFLSS